MNNPITEGAVFKHTWIKWKKLPKFASTITRGVL